MRKANKFFIVFFFAILFFSCKKDTDNSDVDNTTTYLPDNISAGQNSGNGIFYYDFNPDINIILSNASIKQDTSIYMDFNNDGIYDFLFYRKVSDPQIQGQIWDEIDITPLDSNEVCVMLNPSIDTSVLPSMHSQLDWVDTLMAGDTINANCTWTNNKSLIYHYLYGNFASTWQGFTEGPWAYVDNSRYIGFKIIKNNKSYYGWVVLNSTFTITDFAITQEY